MTGLKITIKLNESKLKPTEVGEITELLYETLDNHLANTDHDEVKKIKITTEH